MPQGHRVLNGVMVAAVLIASAAVGVFVGWLVGASATPVVAILLPLAFGLTGVLWQRYTNLRDRVQAAVSLAEQQKADEAIKVMHGGDLQPASDTSVQWATLITSLAIIAFVVAAYAGIQWGLEVRVPTTPALIDLVERDSTLDYHEMLTLTRLRLDLAAMRLGPHEIREVFQTSVLPLLRAPSYRPGGPLHDVRPEALQDIARQLTANVIKREGRNPASVDTVASADSARLDAPPRIRK
jgi:hypothetical protein